MSWVGNREISLFFLTQVGLFIWIFLGVGLKFWVPNYISLNLLIVKKKVQTKVCKAVQMVLAQIDLKFCIQTLTQEALYFWVLT